jgi:hypothetical protein
MLDFIQTVETKDVADAIKSLIGAALKPEQLAKIEISDRYGIKSYLAPGMVTRIISKKFYSDRPAGSDVSYINGEVFFIDLPPEDLAQQLGII